MLLVVHKLLELLLQIWPKKVGEVHAVVNVIACWLWCVQELPYTNQLQSTFEMFSRQSWSNRLVRIYMYPYSQNLFCEAKWDSCWNLHAFFSWLPVCIPIFTRRSVCWARQSVEIASSYLPTSILLRASTEWHNDIKLYHFQSSLKKQAVSSALAVSFPIRIGEWIPAGTSRNSCTAMLTFHLLKWPLLMWTSDKPFAMFKSF